MHISIYIYILIFKRCSLDDFHKYKKPVAQLRGCHDLHTADGESVLNRTAIAYVVNSTPRNQIKSMSLHKGEPSPFEIRFY